ncbi:MAG: HK97 gp10 family phage protein [Lactobacillus sp.]|nr:MAG: HK97 gp10 family phage protein [Lactobacillus sp.]
MDVRIKPEQLSQAIQNELDDYARDVTDTVKEAVEQAADFGVKELRATSPKRTGRYARSWRKRKIHETANELGFTLYAGLYQLTHLLENGHAKRGGGRVRAIRHIKPAEEKVIKKLEDDIQRGIRNG